MGWGTLHWGLLILIPGWVAAIWMFVQLARLAALMIDERRQWREHTDAVARICARHRTTEKGD